ncbi:uncharacterized protein L3040_004114 [Drepanopeziza brunnea f. sp. 'multigermtubi']|uniref:Uncharacterized protein n=1 Tax=Marssonina brunnea f. sp. multigermtubi (strain MB_m1) TaxID=1072389 RepID=K1WTH4_MARBU|nr:uncharacterized protein MBM_09921 [Drepanopeziza brunnea f. sp. 'multigermtubi' MB_m1]EKD11898.1 hypothetical protein MBM_09921 [Drepanopeziza brunnea f. sp. 'multigermtubi' MB_m1]KAJ5042717.1 hypothetical protein L3040_004114 [Drepanopeziza brunnea f. sp. 'multigermtubi']
MSRPQLIGLPNHPDFDPMVLAAVEQEWVLHAASEKLHTRWVAVYNQVGRMVNVARQLEGVRTSIADKAGPMDPATNLFSYYAKPHLRILTVEDMAEAIYRHWLDRPDRQTIDPFYRMINRTYDGPRKEDATWLIRKIKEKTKERDDGVLRNRQPGATRSNLPAATSASSATQVSHNRRPGAAVSNSSTTTSALPVAQTFQSHPIPQTSHHRVGSVPNRTDRSFHTPVSTAPITATATVDAALVSTNITSNRSSAAPATNATTPPPDRYAVQSSAAPISPLGSADLTPSRTTREVSSSNSRHRPEVTDFTTPELESHDRSANSPKKTARPAQRSAPGPVLKSTTGNYDGGGPVRPAGQNGFDSADSLDRDVDTTGILPKRPSAPAQRATYQPGSKGKETERHVDNDGRFTHPDRKLPASTQGFDEDATSSGDRYATRNFERGTIMTSPAPKPLHQEEIWSMKSPRTRSTNNLNNSFFSQPDSPITTSSSNNIAHAHAHPHAPAPASLLLPAHSSLPPKPPTMAPTRPTRTARKGPRERNRGRQYQSRDHNRGDNRGKGNTPKTAAATDSTSHLFANARPEPAMYTPEWELRQRSVVPGCNHNNRFKEDTAHDKITSAVNNAKRASAAASRLGGPPLSAPAGGLNSDLLGDAADAADGGRTDAARRSPSGLGLPGPAADTGMEMGTGKRSSANSSRQHGGGSGSFNPSPPPASSHQPDDMTLFRSSSGAVGVMATGRDVNLGREWPSTSSSRFGRLDGDGGDDMTTSRGGDSGSGGAYGAYGFGDNSTSGSASGFGTTNSNNDNAAAAAATSPAHHRPNQQQRWSRSQPFRDRGRGRIQSRPSRGRIQSHSQSQSQSRSGGSHYRPRAHRQGQPRSHPHSSAFAAAVAAITTGTTPTPTATPTTTGTGTGTTPTGTEHQQQHQQAVTATPTPDTHLPTHDYDHDYDHNHDYDYEDEDDMME